MRHALKGLACWSKMIHPLGFGIYAGWEYLLCRCNTMPLRRYYVAYKILVENKREDLAVQLVSRTAISKKRRLALYIYKNMPHNEELLDIIAHAELKCDTIIDTAAERARRCCLAGNASSSGCRDDS
ncbi:UNVERIFIED_CONTAM: hypothetical protein PYX00_011867 [Menopon gallinae]|uniref:Uncharacterized protein n=1 Tax=Menopon gallinae TaxID=328185 RepID=A0AAW2H8W3_9NEOP